MRDAGRLGLVLASVLSLALPSPGAAARQAAAALQAAPAQPADAVTVAAGIRQVDEGDFEGAIATLDPVADRLVAARSSQAARACLQLGIAHLALDQKDAARRRFRQALDAQPDLRLGADRYSPKVISAFEEARRERDAARRAAAGSGGGSKKGRALLIAGAGVAAGVAIAVLAGGSSASGATGTLRLSGARFAPSAVTCPDGAENLPLTIDIYVDASYDGSETLRITAVTSRLTITNSPAVPSEVGFADSKPTTCTPASVARGGATLHLVTTLMCGNGTGDPARFNDWQGTVAITTMSGTVSADTPLNGLRVNIP